jgi:CheY-like chemotaxis protein
MKEARDLMALHRPDVVLASTHQPKGNGLALCTRLRGFDGGDCLMVVHGAALEDQDMDQLKHDLQAEYEVDHWLSNNASPALVGLVIKQLIKARQKADLSPSGRHRVARPPSMGRKGSAGFGDDTEEVEPDSQRFDLRKYKP